MGAIFLLSCWGAQACRRRFCFLFFFLLLFCFLFFLTGCAFLPSTAHNVLVSPRTQPLHESAGRVFTPPDAVFAAAAQEAPLELRFPWPEGVESSLPRDWNHPRDSSPQRRSQRTSSRAQHEQQWKHISISLRKRPICLSWSFTEGQAQGWRHNRGCRRSCPWGTRSPPSLLPLRLLTARCCLPHSSV